METVELQSDMNLTLFDSYFEFVFRFYSHSHTKYKLKLNDL